MFGFVSGVVTTNEKFQLLFIRGIQHLPEQSFNLKKYLRITLLALV